MSRRGGAVLLLLATIGVCLILAGAAAAQPGDADTPHNMAQGAKYTLWPAPNYRHCTDAGDRVQLTDGKSTREYFWTQTGTVGWSGQPYATVTVDLSRVEPIGGAALTTAAGRAGVTWPAAVHVLVSDDGRTYRDASDLVALDRETHGPWPDGYAIRRLSTDALRTRGRFVQFVIIPSAGGPYLFVDEVEVLRGAESLLEAEPAGEPVANVRDLFVQWRTRSAVQHRFDADVSALEQVIRAENLGDETVRTRLLERLDAIRGQLDPDDLTVDRSFRATLPLSAAHGRLFQLHAELWHAAGYPAFVAEAAVTWDPLELMTPSSPLERRLEVHAMQGESRAAAVNLFNAGDAPMDVRLRFEGLPESPAPTYITVHQVEWTDTGRGVPVPAALPEILRSADGWTIQVPPGLVRQVWLTVRPRESHVGDSAGHVTFSAPTLDRPVRVPLRLRVYPFQMPSRTTLWVGGWSYTNGSGAYGITPQNRQALVRHLQQHGVNAPWATASVLRKFKFADDDPQRIELDTRELDAWLAEWPDARAYLVFLAVGDYSGASKAAFAGAELGSTEFNVRVGTWISAWVAHLRTKGIEPNRLGLLIHDEPHEGTDLTAMLAWARAIRAAEPDVLIWEDPTYRNPAAAPAELFDASDVLCPNRPMWLAAGKPFADFFTAQRERGKVLQSYSCSGPARLLDPYAYYRLQAWHCWRYGGTGSFFWALGDNSGASSWNEYLAARGPYTPLFLDAQTVVAGKQMEAIRESTQDFETLVMLRSAIERARQQGRSDAAVQAAEALLASAATKVLDAPHARGIHWHEQRDRTVADAVRIGVLEAMVSLEKPAAR